MSSPYVSSYDQVFREAFASGLDHMPLEHQGEAIKKIYDAITEAVLDRLENYIAGDMKSNLDDELCRTAAKVAESMLMSAIAGEDKQIKNLFGFNDFYMKNPYMGQLPTQWKLLDSIIERRPDLFIDEKLSQQAVEIDALRSQIKRLEGRIERMGGVA